MVSGFETCRATVKLGGCSVTSYACAKKRFWASRGVNLNLKTEALNPKPLNREQKPHRPKSLKNKVQDPGRSQSNVQGVPRIAWRFMGGYKWGYKSPNMG